MLQDPLLPLNSRLSTRPKKKEDNMASTRDHRVVLTLFLSLLVDFCLFIDAFSLFFIFLVILCHLFVLLNLDSSEILKPIPKKSL